MTATEAPAAAGLQTRVLLVEDNPGDADLVEELLEEAAPGTFEVVRAARMSEALKILKRRAVDVILLDLRLPDADGLEAVEAVREVAGDTPIVVLTGTDDERLALSCIDAGAQDYLCKSEVRPQSLRRAIGYAVSRLRETQLRELQATLDAYRALSSRGTGTSVTASLAGSGAVSLRYPEDFGTLVRDYAALLEIALDEGVTGGGPSREALETVVTRVGDMGGGPRDLLDLHIAALDDLVSGRTDARARALVVEGRLLALQVMGMLVDYFRVGFRRSVPERGTA